MPFNSGIIAFPRFRPGAIMIGDRSVDILAAQSNDFRSIGVLWGFGNSAEIATAEPNYMVTKIGDLVQRGNLADR
jgi:phosphoglycolate phosphatase-like HAD superfamily hydrolase